MGVGAVSRRARSLGLVLAVVIGSVAPSMVAAAVPREPSVSSQTPLPVRDGSARALGAYDASQTIRLAIGLRVPNLVAEQQFLGALQDKSSPEFHRYLSPAQWTARFGPSVAAQNAVVAWATGAGLTVTHLYPNRLIVDVAGPVGAIEKALRVQINTYGLGSNEFFANAADPVLPQALTNIVQSVDGLSDLQTMFPSSRTAHEPANRAYVPGPVIAAGAHAAADGSRAKLRAAIAAKHRATPDITGGAYDPTDIYSSQAYDYNALDAQGHCCNPLGNAGSSPAQTSIAIATFGSQDTSDIQGFQTQYPYLAYNFQEINIDGTPDCCDGEGTMDIEWSTATSNSFGAASDTSKVYAYDGANFNDSTFTDMYNAMVTDNKARVFSTSWSCTEIYGCPASTMSTQNAIFSEMTGQGWTLVTASGDRGAYDDCAHKSVTYPASDPNMVAAGGTTLSLGSGPTYNSEVAWGVGGAGCDFNDGGSGGGCSAMFAAPAYQSNQPCGSASRALPDLSLNADWFNTPQNIFFNGDLHGNGGTSIVAPELAGFFAQENAYLLTEGSICGAGASACAPLGNANYPIYESALFGAPHNPFYDITSGCNSNDIGTGYCAAAGDDEVTGWGSANMLQLAWAINWHTLADNGRPTVTFSGPTPGVWYRTDQVVGVTVADTGGGHPAGGVAGFSAAWDGDPGDPGGEATPGAGNSFYTGPQFPNGTSGSFDLLTQGQGCNTLNVQSWDNMGFPSGDATDGPLCYDSVAPSITSAPKMSLVKNVSVASGKIPVQLSWAGTDATSGVMNYQIQDSVDGGAFRKFGGRTGVTNEFVSLPAGHTYRFRINARDNAGNTSNFTKGKPFRLDLYEERNSSIRYTSGWTRIAQSGASGGFVREATAAGEFATFQFSGKQVGFVTTVSPSNGNARVSKLGGGLGTIVHTEGPTAFASVRYVTSPTGAGPQTLVVSVIGTTGHPNIDIDAFVVIS